MDFTYSPEDEAFRIEVRSWLEANKKFAPPPSNIMADEGAGDWEARVNWHKKLNEGGWVAVNWPQDCGGGGGRGELAKGNGGGGGPRDRAFYHSRRAGPARTKRADDRNGNQLTGSDA